MNLELFQLYQDILQIIVFPNFKYYYRTRFKSLFIDILKNSIISPEEYINIKKIIKGIDKRTTILIKNFPSEHFKNNEELISYFSKIGKINFIYRLKHSNKSKIPYIFIDCVNSKIIISIIKHLLSLFNDLIIIYSNIQGKDSLIKHFLSKKKNKIFLHKRNLYQCNLFVYNKNDCINYISELLFNYNIILIL